MGLSHQLSAMIFELRSAGSPPAKAKALARAWRTIRRLSSADRKLLAEEAGFEGAEELLESLSAKRGGVAPALMLQLLNSVRDQGNEGLGVLMACLKDPKSRDEILRRGVDAVAEAFGSAEAEDEEVPDGDQATPTDTMAVEQEADAPSSSIEDDDETEVDVEPVVDPTRISGSVAENDPVVGEEEPERPPVVQPVAPTAAGPIETGRPAGSRTVDVASVVGALEAEGSLVARMLRLREAISALGGAGAADIGRLVGAFPEGWARRRALTALLEVGLPLDVADALGLIERLEKPVDRRWCLAVLIGRGDLRGAEVDQALEMAESPALRRRIRRAWELPASESR